MKCSRVVAAIGLLLGCGDVKNRGEGSEADAAATDAAMSDAAAGDAADARPARCDPDADFGAPEPLVGLNHEDPAVEDESPSLTADELWIYFDSNRPGGEGGYDLFFARRESRDEPFSDPQPLADLNSAGPERNPAITGDGLQLYVTTGPNTALDLQVATRANDTQPFGPLSRPSELNPEGINDATAYPMEGAIYFASNRPTAGSADQALWRASWNGVTFEDFEMVEGEDVASPVAEIHPVLTPDELTLFYASNREGSQVTDIYVARRASRDVPFEQSERLDVVNGPGIDSPSWVSDDGCVLYLTQEQGGYEMFFATRGR
jgi:Tol biopolymer transport system component